MIDDYKILKKLGAGMYGTVYLVEKNGKKYALKIEHILEKDVKKNTHSPVWREIDFCENLANKYPEQFVQLKEYDIIDKCKHDQQYPRQFFPGENKYFKAIADSPYCSRKIFTLVDTSMDKINITTKLFYSLIIQILYAIYLMRKNGYVHTDIHVGNVGLLSTKKKYIKIFGYNVPLFGYQVQILDFGLVSNKKYKLNKFEKRIYKDFMAKEAVMTLARLGVNMDAVWKYVDPKYNYKESIMKFSKSKEAEFLSAFANEVDDKYFLYQHVFPVQFQKELFGKKFKDVIPSYYFISLLDLSFAMKNYKDMRKIIEYFIYKLKSY